MSTKNSKGFLLLVSFLFFSHPGRSYGRDKPVEFFLGGGGGYEYYKMTSASAKAIQNSIGEGCTQINCIKPDEITGSGGLWRVFGGFRLGFMGLGIDYRQSYLEGPVSWGQLMGDFWVFLPVPVIKPFIKLGAGFIHLKVKGIELAGTKHDGDLVKGFGFKGGAGLIVKIKKWFSIGASCEIVGTYFREDMDTTWGYAIDATGHIMFHI